MSLHHLEIIGVLVSAGSQYSQILLRLLYLLLKLGYGLGGISHFLRKIRDVAGINYYMYFRNFLG